MSVPPVPSEQPAVRTRPGTVTAAAILMFVVTAVSLLFAALTIISAAVVTDEMLRKELTKQQPNIPSEQLDATVAVYKPSLYATGALLVVFAIVLAVLAVLVFKGSRVGRILTWVVTGLYALCGFCLAGGAVGGGSGAGGLLGALPPVVLLLGSVGVIVLLALPASNQYFTKVVPQWQPPAEFAAEVATDAGPGTPTAPQAPAPQAPAPQAPAPQSPETPAAPPESAPDQTTGSQPPAPAADTSPEPPAAPGSNDTPPAAPGTGDTPPAGPESGEAPPEPRQ